MSVTFWPSIALLVGLGLAAPAVAQPGLGRILEPQTGVAFPVELTPPGGGVPQRLAGVGVRDRTIFRVKIYAFGLYVDSQGARAALAPFAGVSAGTLAADDRFYRRILDMDFGMTLRLVMVRDVAGNAVADAFDSALRPRVARAAADRGLAGGSAALDRFRGYFNLSEVEAGTEIVFACRPGGRLDTTVGGEPRPAIESPALCWALFDVYLGQKPISSAGKRTVVDRVPLILEQRSP